MSSKASYSSGSTLELLTIDSFKEPGAGYKTSITDGNTGADPARNPGSVTVSADYRCVSIVLAGDSAESLYRLGSSAPTLSTFDGFIKATDPPVLLRLPEGENTIKFITVATGSSPAGVAYVTGFKEET